MHMKEKRAKVKQIKSQETNRKRQVANKLSLTSDVNPWTTNRGMTENISMIQMLPYA